MEEEWESGEMYFSPEVGKWGVIGNRNIENLVANHGKISLTVT